MKKETERQVTGMKKRIMITALLALLALLTGCVRQAAPESAVDGSELRVSFIDVGKGDCILLEKDGSCVLIDAGYAETAPEVTAFLEERGVTALDAMIITHYDKDHVGGASALAQAFPVGQLYLPGYEGSSKHYTALMKTAEEQSLSCQQVTRDVSFSLAGADVAIYASHVAYEPEGEKEANDNDVSLVIAVTYGADAYLFAGDIEKDGIKAYLAGDHGAFDVVKMPHHGGYEKNTGDFIQAVQPEIAVITDSGEDPADGETLTLLENAGAQILRTAEIGTVTVTSSGTGSYQVA